MVEYTVDLAGVKNKLLFHNKLVQVLPFPLYYGKNLDALYDVLVDAHPMWEITFLNCQDAVESMGDYMANVWMTFAEAIDAGAAVRVVWKR